MQMGCIAGSKFAQVPWELPEYGDGVHVYLERQLPKLIDNLGALAGTDHVVALLRGGALLSFGTGEQGQLGRVSAQPPERGLKELLLTPAEVTLKRAASAVKADPIVDVAASNYTSFAVTKKGQVWAWGLNNYGQLAQEGEVRPCIQHKYSA